jgi:hypothetical protein
VQPNLDVKRSEFRDLTRLDARLRISFTAPSRHTDEQRPLRSDFKEIIRLGATSLIYLKHARSWNVTPC